MFMRRLRWAALAAVCGGTLFQAAGCETLLPQLLGGLATSVALSLLQGLLLGT